MGCPVTKMIAAVFHGCDCIVEYGSYSGWFVVIPILVKLWVVWLGSTLLSIT